jgi:hypothetical protein
VNLWGINCGKPWTIGIALTYPLLSTSYSHGFHGKNNPGRWIIPEQYPGTIHLMHISTSIIIIIVFT